MENVEKLLKASLDEVDKLLSSKRVVGDPIKMGEETIIPLLSFGFGFGAGGGVGMGNDKSKRSGEGGGSGAGAGVKPVAVIISDGHGHTRIEPIAGALSDSVGKIANTISNVFNKNAKEKDSNDQNNN